MTTDDQITMAHVEGLWEAVNEAVDHVEGRDGLTEAGQHSWVAASHSMSALFASEANDRLVLLLDKSETGSDTNE